MALLLFQLTPLLHSNKCAHHLQTKTILPLINFFIRFVRLKPTPTVVSPRRHHPPTPYPRPAQSSAPPIPSCLPSTPLPPPQNYSAPYPSPPAPTLTSSTPSPRTACTQTPSPPTPLPPQTTPAATPPAA